MPARRPARARELVMTGELYDAATLERWNVVNRVLPGEGFDAAARAFARKARRRAQRAHAATKGSCGRLWMAAAHAGPYEGR